MRLFINPYNFVPFQPVEAEKERISREAVYRGMEPLYSGYLTIRLDTKTPLIIPDGAHPKYYDPKGKRYVLDPGTEEKKQLHKEYAFLRIPSADGDGALIPVIPGSELRGMIRSLYETVTNSCVGFLLNDKNISQRVPTFGSLQKRGLLAYEKIDPEDESSERRWVLYSTIAEKIEVTVDKNGNIREKDGGPFTEKNGSFVENHGWVQYNIPVSNKDHYHVAYLQPDEPLFRWDFLTADLKPDNKKNGEPYDALKSALDRDGVSEKRNANQAPNRNLANALEKAKKGGNNMVPVYYFIVHRGEETLVYLSNSSIGRIAQRRKWEEIMGMHAPCSNTDQLCPACLLFGTTNGKGMRGHVRFSDALPVEISSYETHTLQILGEPRTTAFEFYLRKPEDAEGGKVTYWNFDFYGVKKTYMTKGGKRIDRTEYHDLVQASPRGRKMYWHGPIAPDAAKDRMNSTMEALSGSFEFKIYFDEITERQLKDLIWVVTLGENRKDSKRQQKLGHAKPLGYGSVKMIVQKQVVRTITGTTLENAANLSGETEDHEEFQTLFLNTGLDITQGEDIVISPSFSSNPGLAEKSLIIMCNADSTKDFPVRYPTKLDKNGNEFIYTWFSGNRRNAESVKTLPEPTDESLTLEGEWNDTVSGAAVSDISYRRERTISSRHSGDQQSLVSKSQMTGKIDIYYSERGYGFIRPNGGGGKLFFHIRSFKGNDWELTEGAEVIFEKVPSQKRPGTYEARNVRLK